MDILHFNLPHIDINGTHQFVTFRTKDSLDNFLKKTLSHDSENSIRQYKIDQYLDFSQHGAYLNDSIINELKQYFLSYDQKIFDIFAFSIMPNHIHILFKQRDSLSSIMSIIKGGSSYIANKALKRKGKFWANNYYDRAIRDEKHFWIVYKYIKNNALKANLEDYQKRFYGLYE